MPSWKRKNYERQKNRNPVARFLKESGRFKMKIIGDKRYKKQRDLTVSEAYRIIEEEK